MTGHQRVVMQGTALALLFNVAVAYLAIPRFGVAGKKRALGATLGLVCWNTVYVAYALVRLDLNTTIIKSVCFRYSCQLIELNKPNQHGHY